MPTDTRELDNIINGLVDHLGQLHLGNPDEPLFPQKEVRKIIATATAAYFLASNRFGSYVNAYAEFHQSEWVEFIQELARVQHVALGEGQGPRSDLVLAAEMLCRPPSPPAKGEVGELAVFLRDAAFDLNESDPAKSMLTRAADLLEQRHPAPVPVAWMYRGEPDYDGREWRERWCVTTSQQVAEYKALPNKPIPLFTALPLPS